MFIVASPHLLISMSIMNTYSSLGIVSLIIGYLGNKYRSKGISLQKLFLCYIVASVITDMHHWYKAWQTSLPGQEIAKEIVKKTGKSVNNVYCILIRDDMPKFSSFCVPIDEAVGWGRAVWGITGYKWPTHLADTTLERTPNVEKKAIKLAKRVKTKNYDCVWIINKENVEVIK